MASNASSRRITSPAAPLTTARVTGTCCRYAVTVISASAQNPMLTSTRAASSAGANVSRCRSSKSSSTVPGRREVVRNRQCHVARQGSGRSGQRGGPGRADREVLQRRADGDRVRGLVRPPEQVVAAPGEADVPGKRPAQVDAGPQRGRLQVVRGRVLQHGQARHHESARLHAHLRPPPVCPEGATEHSSTRPAGQP